MKYALIILLTLTIIPSLIYNNLQYKQTIRDHAESWKQMHIETLQNPHHLQTLIDLILLSYQIAKESCHMMIAKLTIQEELLKLYTPSLVDSWQTNMQVIHNDTSKIEEALTEIQNSQELFQSIFQKLKIVGQELIQINPQPTQTIIDDLKEALLIWAKEQQEFAQKLNLIQAEFTTAIISINDIKMLFETTLQQQELKKANLKNAANSISKAYKDIESITDLVTKIRKENMSEIKFFFSEFFKIYYSMLYKMIPNNQTFAYKTLATEDGHLPYPDLFFLED